MATFNGQTSFNGGMQNFGNYVNTNYGTQNMTHESVSGLSRGGFTIGSQRAQKIIYEMNGKSVSAAEFTATDGKFTADGQKVDVKGVKEDGNIVYNIIVKGSSGDIKATNVNSIKVEGGSGAISLTNGNLDVGNNVNGTVIISNGKLTTNGGVMGNVNSTNSSIVNNFNANEKASSAYKKSKSKKHNK